MSGFAWFIKDGVMNFGAPTAFPDGTSAAPGMTFSSDSTKGIFGSVAGAVSFSAAGAEIFRYYNDSAHGINIAAAIPLSWTLTNPDLFLWRDGAADTLAMRRTTNGQTIRLYNTYTDASNYERTNLGWSSNQFNLLVGALGTGASRSIAIGTDSTSSGSITFQTAGTNRWQILGSGNVGHILAIGGDNTYDIGASGANRPRTMYIGTSINIGSNFTLSANTASGALQLNGTSSSFPAWKQVGADVSARLADDSAATGIIGVFKSATTSPATQGALRLANADTVQARNGANSADITILSLNSSNLVVVGSSVGLLSATAPTISSGFGTSPSIANNNGTAAFTVNVGTGGAASSGVIGLPTATTGWNCWVQNLTAQAANRGDQHTIQTASTTTTVTVQNQTISTGAALAWTASDILRVTCVAY